jgi:hypothetical protein
MTNLPDWLVERVALDEVPPASKTRVDAADANEVAARVAELRAEDAAELSAYPAGPAIAQIEKRARREVASRRRRWMFAGGLAVTVAAAAVLWIGVRREATEATPVVDRGSEYIGLKGDTRLLAFRLAGDRVEQLEQDNVVKPGDVLQLRYNAAGKHYGMIASIDGAGAVTLHFPASEDARTELQSRTTSLPNAYALDEAPRFERFFFITANEPIDVHANLEVLRELAKSDDAASATPEVATSVYVRSLRLRKPDSK